MDAFIFPWLIAGVIAVVFTHRVLRHRREVLTRRAVPVWISEEER